MEKKMTEIAPWKPTITDQLADLISRVRHGDDCTANDLAERLINGGLVVSEIKHTPVYFRDVDAGVFVYNQGAWRLMSSGQQGQSRASRGDLEAALRDVGLAGHDLAEAVNSLADLLSVRA